MLSLIEAATGTGTYVSIGGGTSVVGWIVGWIIGSIGVVAMLGAVATVAELSGGLSTAGFPVPVRPCGDGSSRRIAITNVAPIAIPAVTSSTARTDLTDLDRDDRDGAVLATTASNSGASGVASSIAVSIL